VDDDLGARETFQATLRLEGFTVATAGSGAEALAKARSRQFDFLLLDLNLGDMLGTDVARVLRNEAALVPFALMSAYLTTEVTVEAMKLGAWDVMDKPVTTERLHHAVFCAIAEISDPTHRTTPLRTLLSQRPESMAERWAVFVLRACFSKTDLRTVREWAERVYVSQTSLSESCQLLGIAAKDARDLMRCLRAVLRSAHLGCPLQTLFYVGDRRTLRSLLERARVDADGQPPSADEFLHDQQFVPCENDGVQALRKLLNAGVFRSAVS
jgi:CheY-like chemotaxis protein